MVQFLYPLRAKIAHPTYGNELLLDSQEVPAGYNAGVADLACQGIPWPFTLERLCGLP